MDTYADTILRVCYTYLRSTQDAEDICQDVLLKVLQRPQRFFSADHERAWIIRVAANACKDLLKSRGTRATVALDDAPEPASAPHATEAQLTAQSRSVLQSHEPARELSRGNLPALLRGVLDQADRGAGRCERIRHSDPTEPRAHHATPRFEGSRP